MMTTSRIKSVACIAFFIISLSMYAEELSLIVNSFSPCVLSVPDSLKAEMSLTLNCAADICITIIDQDNEKLHEFKHKGQIGNNILALDFTELRPQLFEGPFFFSVAATSDDGHRVTYYPTYDSALQQIKIQKWSYAAEKKTFEFLMPALGMANIRLYRKPNFYVCTLYEWAPMTAGPTTLKWNGKDPSGNDIFLSQEDAEIRFSAYTLPTNAFVVHAPVKKPRRSVKGQVEWKRSFPNFSEKFPPAQMPRERAHEPRLNLEVEKDNGEWVHAKAMDLDKAIRLRLKVHSDDVQQAIDERFEICVYIDGQLFFEEEDGVTPYTFKFDPADIGSGRHLLTVMILTSFDHIGSVSSFINILKENPRKQQ